MNVVELLQQLIRIPSVNPDDAPGTDRTHEQDIAEWLKPFLEGHGFEVTLEEVLPGRPNLIARSPGGDDRKRIMLAPHLDTVGVGGMTIDPFCGELKDGKIWGRGASDTKGPMAAMIMSLIENKEILADLPVAIDFVAFMGEESTQQGSKHFAKHHGEEYVFGIAGEPTSLDLVHVTKGATWITVEAHGKAAHSSQPQLGENAIMILARSLDMINRKLSNRLATYTHPILGHSTLNIGTIRGGSRPNIVPDYASAQIDFRTTPSLQEAGGAVKLLESFIEEMQLPIKVKSYHENPPMETAADHLYIQKILESSTESSTVGAPWFSDAAHLTAGGIPSICAGPGSIDQAHTKDEWIKISDLEAGVGFFSNFVRSFQA